jgi:uncharacterized protein (DUF2384 family)
MATWKYGPIKVQEDWGIEWKDAEYSIEYNTTSDTMAILRTSEGKTTSDLMGHEPANAIAKMMSEWLLNYEGEIDFLRKLVKDHDLLFNEKNNFDKEYNTILNILIYHFQGDSEKAKLWINTPNPLLGGTIPLDMIKIGRYGTLISWIANSLQENFKVKT